MLTSRLIQSIINKYYFLQAFFSARRKGIWIVDYELKERGNMKKKVLSASCAGIVVLCLALTYLFIQKLHMQSDNKMNQMAALEKLESITDSIQTDFNESLNYADFLAVLVAKDPDMKESTIKEYSQLILKQNKNISSVQLAPNAVVSFICPLKGNEAAIGHNLLEDPERKAYAQAAIEKRISVTQGPVQAKQGGYLVFNRKAIFITKDHQEQFWGLSIIAVNFSGLMEKYDRLLEKAGFYYGIRSVGNGDKTEKIWGDDSVFNKECVTDTVILPDMNWRIAIYPKNGWNHEQTSFDLMNVFFCAAAVLIFILVYMLAEFYQKQLLENRTDFLTGTLNKKTWLKIVKRRLDSTRQKCAVILLDLNNFKEINDQLGHPVGDAVLIHAARRIENVLDKTDKLSRFGGDEYFVYISQAEETEKMLQVIQKIKSEVSVPMMVEEHVIELSVAAGYAVYPDDGRTFEELYLAADVKMYEDKAGRNGRTKDEKYDRK